MIARVDDLLPLTTFARGVLAVLARTQPASPEAVTRRMRSVAFTRVVPPSAAQATLRALGDLRRQRLVRQDGEGGPWLVRRDGWDALHVREEGAWAN